MTDENTARRLDLEMFYVETEYAHWTTDPDDPEVVAERKRREQLGLKPPPRPVIFPHAQRPAHVLLPLLERYAADQEAANTPDPGRQTGRVGSDAFDAALGIEDEPVGP